MVVSVREVAARAQVSVGTVSNVLNVPEKVAPDTVVKVQVAIRELGYVRNGAARQLRAGRSTSLALIVLDVRNPFFTDLARGAEDAAAEAGLSLLLGNSDERADREAAYFDLFDEQRVAGLLVSPIGDVSERVARIRSRGTPTVLVDRVSSDVAVSSVSVDDVAGGRMAAAHLLDTGRRRLAFVGGPLSIRQVADRLVGARDALKSVHDAALEELATAAMTVAEGRRVGEMLVARPLGARPDAVFAANDLLATGLLQAFVIGGSIRVPDDISLIGFDDIDFAAAAAVPLSSMRQPSQQMGRTAVQLLLEEMENPSIEPRRIEFLPTLVARASTVA